MKALLLSNTCADVRIVLKVYTDQFIMHSTTAHVQACYMNHVPVIELLVASGTKAFVDQPNAKKMTAHDMCITDAAREALLGGNDQVLWCVGVWVNVYVWVWGGEGGGGGCVLCVRSEYG